MSHEEAREPTPISLHPHFLLVLLLAKSEVLPVAYEGEKQSSRGEEAGAEEARPATVTLSDAHEPRGEQGCGLGLLEDLCWLAHPDGAEGELTL